MAENKIFKITEVEGGIIVTEFERGNQRSITVDDYVAQGNDLKNLFTDYFNKHPEKTSNLIFSDTDDPNTGSITYKNAVIDVFDKKDLQSLINGEDQFLGLVSYPDILQNTRELMPEKKEGSDTSLDETFTEIKEELKEGGLRSFINKHKVPTALILGFLLILSLVIGILLSTTSAPPKIEVTDDHVAKYFNEKKQFLDNFEKKYAGNELTAKIQINLFLNELNKYKKEDIPEKHRAAYEALLLQADKYKALLDKK